MIHSHPGYGIALFGTEGLDLLVLGLGQLPRHLALAELVALHLVTDALHHLRVGQRGHVADVGEVGDRGDHPAHDLPGPGLGHVRHDPHVLGPGDLADLGLDRAGDLAGHLVAGGVAGLERDVYLDRPAADVVHDRDRGRLCDLGHRQRRGFDLLGAQPVPGHVDHVVDAAEDPVVPVGCPDRAVAGEVGPVVPVLAARVLVVLLVVDVDEPLGLAPDRLHDPGPGVADADVAGLAVGYLVPVLVVDGRVDADHRRAAAARLHRLQGRQRAAEEAPGLGLPPGVHDDRLALADLLVVPAPDLGLDRLTHRGHVLEVVVVLGRLVRADLAQHPDGGGRGVEDVHAEPLGDPPGAPGVGVVGRALIDHAGRAEGQRPVDDVGVAGDPPDVGHAPVRVLGVDVLVVLGRPGHVGEVATGGVLGTLGTPGGPAGVHEEQRRLGRH